MGQIKKIGETYYIEFYARGLLYSQVAGPNLEDAQKLLEVTEAKIAQGEALTIVREIELPDFFERFLTQYHLPKTKARYTTLIKHFNAFLKNQFPNISRLSQITPSVAESYKIHLSKDYPRKPKLINFSILLLREILEFGIKIGFINDNPTIHVRLLAYQSRSRTTGARYQRAADLFAKGISFGKVYQLLGLNDIGQMMYFSALIPLQRQDMYL